MEVLQSMSFGVSRILVAVLAVLTALACLTSSASADQTDPTNPLVGKRQFMDCGASHDSPAPKYNPWYFARKHSKYESLIRKTAEVPQAKWFAGIQEKPTRHVEKYLAAVDDPRWGGERCNTRLALGRRDAYVGSYPIVAIRRLVNGSCEGMKRQSAAGYKAWIEAFIAQTRLTFIPDQGQRYQYWMGKRFSRGTWAPIKREMTVILEPDAIGLMGARRSCLKRSQVPGRLALLAYAAKRLGETPGMNVYIDGASSSWLKQSKVIDYLRRGGVAYTRGFALGATHFNRTSREIQFGDNVARALGGKHYVINTAENANGPLPKSRWGKYGSRATTCNPPNAGLGNQPTTRTGSAWADAFLWISRPGLSSNGKSGNYNCGPKQGPLGNTMWLNKLLYEGRQANFTKASWPPLPL